MVSWSILILSPDQPKVTAEYMRESEDPPEDTELDTTLCFSLCLPQIEFLHTFSSWSMSLYTCESLLKPAFLAKPLLFTNYEAPMA